MIDELPFKEEVLDFVDPPTPLLSTYVTESPKSSSKINQISPDFSNGLVRGSSPFVPSDFEFTPLNDDNFFDDFDPVNQIKESEVSRSVHESTPLQAKENETQPPIVRESIDVLLKKMKKCSVPLYDLPIVFVKSDTESNSEDDNHNEDKVVKKENFVVDVSLMEEVEWRAKNNSNSKTSKRSSVSYGKNN